MKYGGNDTLDKTKETVNSTRDFSRNYPSLAPRGRGNDDLHVGTVGTSGNGGVGVKRSRGGEEEEEERRRRRGGEEEGRQDGRGGRTGEGEEQEGEGG